MTLQKNLWMTFDGEPVLGRPNTKLVVVGGEMTGEQRSEVARMYRLFCMEKDVSVFGDKYFVSNRKLKDGSPVRMVSYVGLDTVTVQVSSPEVVKEVDWLSGFVCTARQRLMGDTVTYFDNVYKHYYWQDPFTDPAGEPINPPHGTRVVGEYEVFDYPSHLPVVANSQTILTKMAISRSQTWVTGSVKNTVDGKVKTWTGVRTPKWSKTYGTEVLAGNIDWVGPDRLFGDKPTIVTIFGPQGRHTPRTYVNSITTDERHGVHALDADGITPFTNTIYALGKKIGIVPNTMPPEWWFATTNVVGAAVKRDSAGRMWLVAVTTHHGESIWIRRLDLAEPDLTQVLYHPHDAPYGWKLISEDVDIPTAASAADTQYAGLIGDASISKWKPSDERCYTPFFFNSSATECQSIKMFACYKRVKWTITWDGYNSTAARSTHGDTEDVVAVNPSGPIIMDAITFVIAADYVGDTEVTASLVCPAATDTSGEEMIRRVLFSRYGGEGIPLESPSPAYDYGRYRDRVAFIDPRHGLLVTMGPYLPQSEISGANLKLKVYKNGVIVDTLIENEAYA